MKRGPALFVPKASRYGGLFVCSPLKEPDQAGMDGPFVVEHTRLETQMFVLPKYSALESVMLETVLLVWL
jgi:hypothetical protein